MGEVDINDVYRKIKEIRDSRKNDKKKPIHIDDVVRELDSTKDLVKGYVNALTILEFVEQPDKDNIVLLR